MSGQHRPTRQRPATVGDSGWRPPHTSAAARSSGSGRRVPATALWSVAALVAVIACLIVGVPPGLGLALVLLVLAIRYPFAGLLYVLIVLTVPLGLWMTGVQALVGLAFGGRDYVLSLSGAVVVCALAAVTVLRRWGNLPRRWLGIGAGGAVVATVWAAIGIGHHGVAQTFTGLRLILIPVALIVIMSALASPVVERLLTVLSWLLIANGVAAVVELAIGPTRLLRLGFSRGHAIRFIDGVFRTPGLTEVNAELGMLAGAYLLGYVASWLTPGRRPHRRSWHVGAVAAMVCLALSTSRSGAVLAVGGVLGAVVLQRSANRARRRLSLAVGGGLLVAVAAAFAMLGATGATSLFQRFGVWRRLLSDVPLIGYGIGSAGGATFSRVATSKQVFVDNYYITIGLQFGPVVMALVVIGVIAALVLLSRASARRPTYLMSIAVVSGLACASLVLDSWEYTSAMLVLILFHAYGVRQRTRVDGDPRGPAVPCAAWAPSSTPRSEDG